MSKRAKPTPAAPDPARVARFAADLDALIAPRATLGLAVSGGPDSIALLLLASAARPGKVEAASVDHGLRAQSGAEADSVASLCARIGVPHSTLRLQWDEKPSSAIQEKARIGRYASLARWLDERGLDALATAHHLDDQVETLMMRLNRGSGVRGLGAIRDNAVIPGSTQRLVRPLLGWRRSELEQVCREAAITPADDPSNSDERFERVRIRAALAGADWLDPLAIAQSAAHLAAADTALDWAAKAEWDARVTQSNGAIDYSPSAPPEIRRRVVERAIDTLASEGGGRMLRGRELDRLLHCLSAGNSATLRGVRCSGGETWRFERAPERRG